MLLHLTTTRTIDYVKAGEACSVVPQQTPSCRPSTGRKTQICILKATGDASMPVTVQYQSKWGLSTIKLIKSAVVPAVKSPLTAADATDSQQVANDLGEYLPDLSEVAAIAPIYRLLQGGTKRFGSDSNVHAQHFHSIDNPGH
jgi:hypothetical protein